MTDNEERIQELEEHLKIVDYILKQGKFSRGKFTLVIENDNNHSAYEWLKKLYNKEKDK